MQNADLVSRSDTATCDALSEDELLRELALLYNYRDDDSQQFTRWQMVVAIAHGFRLARARDSAL